MLRVSLCSLVLTGCLAMLAGCGGSSSTSSSSANPSVTTTATGATTAGAKAAKGPNAASGRGGLAKPPVTRSPITPARKGALTKFATCMRENGVKFPLPNTSGKGPIFSAKGLDLASPTFRAAERKCRGDLLGALRPHRGVGKASGTAGATGTAGQTKTSPAPKLKTKVPPKVTHALQHFTACMREHGVTNYPEPEGATFNTSHSHLDPGSAQYKAAEKKCNHILNAIA